MATKIYGRSDDLVEFDGDVDGEVSCYATEDKEHGVLVICDDGTLLEVKYGKGKRGIWGVTLLKAGSLFDRIEPCDNEDAPIYSDVAHFKDGLKSAYAATDWEPVK